jgi:hypothetical protein
MNAKLADELERLCCAETEGKFFDAITDNIQTIIAALRGPKNTFDILRRLVDEVEGFPGWSFGLIDDDEGLRLRIVDSKCVDSYQPDRRMPLAHFFPVPVTTWNEESWKRWIFDCALGALTHECGEWLRFGEDRPFAPAHGPGENPYVVNTYRPKEVAFTTQDGSMRPMP